MPWCWKTCTKYKRCSTNHHPSLTTTLSISFHFQKKTSIGNFSELGETWLRDTWSSWHSATLPASSWFSSYSTSYSSQQGQHAGRDSCSEFWDEKAFFYMEALTYGKSSTLCVKTSKTWFYKLPAVWLSHIACKISSKIYYSYTNSNFNKPTRGPWTATPPLIKIDEKGRSN